MSVSEFWLNALMFKYIEMIHLLNLSSDDMEALVEHREKLDAELEQLRENRMELEGRD